jgi:hypothetical protein
MGKLEASLWQALRHALSAKALTLLIVTASCLENGRVAVIANMLKGRAFDSAFQHFAIRIFSIKALLQPFATAPFFFAYPAWANSEALLLA